MVKHIVFWKLKDAAGGAGRAENARSMKTKLEALRGRIPGLRNIEVGIDFSQSPVSYHVALYAELESRAALEFYQAHPDHQAVAAFNAQVSEVRAVVDYEV